MSEFKRTCPIIKSEEVADERFVLGIVLEPESVDAQFDIYSSDEVRSAAHKFMTEYRNVHFMHKYEINGDVEILESYLAPADMMVENNLIKKGTWLMAVKVNSEEQWKMVKSGELTGFSIGGHALRIQES